VSGGGYQASVLKDFVTVTSTLGNVNVSTSTGTGTAGKSGAMVRLSSHGWVSGFMGVVGFGAVVPIVNNFVFHYCLCKYVQDSLYILVVTKLSE
jgi:hypothetical protein